MNGSKKNIIKHTAIVFLLTELLLTFFSRTINQYLLPEVEVRYTSRGSLHNETRASGEVKILHTRKIYSPGSLSIIDVNVKKGDNVSEGDILLSVDTSQAEMEIKSMEFDLLRLKNDLKDSEESFKPFDAAPYEEEIAMAQKAVEREKQNLDIIRSIYSKDIQDHIDAASKRVEQAKKDFSDKMALYEEMKKEAEKVQDEYDRTVKEMKLAMTITSMKISQLREIIDDESNTHPSYDQLISLRNLELEYQKQKNQLELYIANYTPIDINECIQALISANEVLKQEEENLKQVIESYEQSSENRLRLFNAQCSLEDAEVALMEKQEQLIKKQEESIIDQDRYTRDISEKKAEIKLKAEQLDNLKKTIPAGGNITAPCDGVIRFVGVESGQISNNQQILFEILESNSKFSVQWLMNPAQSEQIKEGDKVSLKIKGESDITIDSRVDEKKFSSEHGMYLFTSEIPAQEEYPLEEGQEVEISIRETSQDYPLIVPTRCISMQNGINYVFVLRERQGALGHEYYVEQINVTIIESDDLNTAITGYIKPEDKVVVDSSKALFQNAQVKLR